MVNTANNCFRHQNRNFLEYSPIKIKEIISEILDSIQTTEMILETEMVVSINFLDPIMYSDLQTGNHQLALIWWFPLSKKFQI